MMCGNRKVQTSAKPGLKFFSVEVNFTKCSELLGSGLWIQCWRPTVHLYIGPVLYKSILDLQEGPVQACTAFALPLLVTKAGELVRHPGIGRF